MNSFHTTDPQTQGSIIVQAYLILLHFLLLPFTFTALYIFLQTEGKSLHQQKDYLLYCSGLELNPQYLRGMPVFSFIDLTVRATNNLCFKQRFLPWDAHWNNLGNFNNTDARVPPPQVSDLTALGYRSGQREF